MKNKALSVWTSMAISGTTHLIIAILIQMENFVFYISIKTPGLFPKILLGQFENLVISIFLAVPLFFLAWNKVLRLVYGIVFLLCGIYLLLNQVFYQLFFDHYQLSFSDGSVEDISVLWDSFYAELSPLFAVNLSFLLGIQGFLIWILTKPASYALPHWMKAILKKPKFFLLMASPIFFIIMFFSYSNPDHNLTRHPIISLVSNWLHNPPEDYQHVKPENTAQLDLKKLRYGRPRYLPEKEKELNSTLEKVANEIRNREKFPNIVFFVLESIGSQQILTKDNHFDREVTPNLFAYSQNMVLFPAIYNTVPRTTRSHIVISTGGRAPTSGNVFELLSKPYLGPTLVGELKDKGYITGLYSATDLGFEKLGELYKNFNYHSLFEPFSVDKKTRKENKIHSWGIDEKLVLDHSLQWIDTIIAEQPDPVNRNPFFLHFLTISAHHPYGIPKGFQTPFKGNKRKMRYKKSIYYTDYILGVMVKELKKRNLLDNTLLIIAGDHGQAFGEHHQKNFTHQHYLYEENIKNFLAIFDFSKVHQTVVSEKQAFLGDIMPTILSLTESEKSSPKPNIPGRNLFSSKTDEELVYFHKNSKPALWGLKDGKWKFISTITDQTAELYDLEKDPREQSNLATQYPDRVKKYYSLCAQWYSDSNSDFLKNMEGIAANEITNKIPEEIERVGPTHIEFGVKPKGDFFRELKIIHPNESLVVWTYGIVPFKADTRIEYQWISPTGKKQSSFFTIKKGWTNCWVPFTFKEYLEEGEWQLELLHGKNKILSGSFTVSASVNPIIPRLNESELAKNLDADKSVGPGPQQLKFGYKTRNGEFVELPRIHPYENMSVWTSWKPYPDNKKILYQWTSPSGDRRSFSFNVRAKWTTTRVSHSPYFPMETGKWDLDLSDGEETLISGSFLVDPEAKTWSSSPEILPRIERIEVTLFPQINTIDKSITPERVPRTPHTLSCKAHWSPRKFNYKIVLQCKSPSGSTQSNLLRLKAKKNLSSNQMPIALENGEWTLSYTTEDGNPLGEKTVRIEHNPESEEIKISEIKTRLNDQVVNSIDNKVISFVHFNDLHANYHPIDYNGFTLSPLSLIRGYFNQIKSQNPNTIFCSAGDEMEKGSLVDVISNGESTIQIYKALNLDLRAVGNHDFAYSLDSIRRFVNEPGDIVLCTNQSLGKNYHEFQVDGVKFGVFSMVCKPWDERDKQYKGPYYPEVDARYDFVKVAREIVDLHREDVDILFMLSHLGIKDDKKVSNQVPGIDFIIGGHSHTLLKSATISSTGTVIVQVGAWGKYVGRLDINVDKKTKKMTGHQYSVTKVHPDSIKPDLILEHQIRDILGRYHAHIETPIAWLDKDYSKIEVAQLTALAAKQVLPVEAVLLDTTTVWKPLPAGPHNRQDFLDCFKVEIQRCGTHGFNSILTADISGRELNVIKLNGEGRFLFEGPQKIDPRKTYRIAIQRRTALRIEDFFTNISTLSNLRFEMEIWEMLTKYFLELPPASSD